MLLRLWEFGGGGGGGGGGAVRPSPRWLATIWWGRFLVIHIMMAHQFRRVMKQTMVWKREWWELGYYWLIAGVFFACERVTLCVSKSKSKKDTYPKRWERERERLRLFVLLFGIRVGGSSRWTYYTLNDCDGLWDQIQTRPFNLLYIPTAIYEIGLVRRKE